ncbi:MAG: APC family permease [Anaerolineales bacterium]|nr:APC family permease [Anaerolineales bacterium]MCB8953261.1 APC family permease [Ardenticatenales bacterium]
MAFSLGKLKRALIGEPFPTRAEVHERLDKVRALAIFASDPISSNAYATEAIMTALAVGLGAGALRFTLPLALGVMFLVLLVVFSYIQTILHYPDGGGAYTVAKDNLGTNTALFAASALLIDYILTVAVSVSAGIRAITSAVPGLHDHAVPMALIAILLLTWVNLRGVRESGTIFALPTYAFVGGVLLTVGVGLLRLTGLFGLAAMTPPTHDTAITVVQSTSQLVFIWVLLRSFAAGCTALTGIEAISNGVQAFKPPEPINAVKTMVAMGVIAMSLFVGITFLATHLALVPHLEEGESILSQLARTVWTGLPAGQILYYWVQFFTMMILVLAANTGYQDFPRLSSFLAKDGYLPRWMQNRGDRLVYNAGIVILAIVASIIVIIFRADEIAMLPLYALGVMLSFSLSQAGMFRLMGRIGHLKPGEHIRTKVTTIHYESGARWKRIMNAVGAIVTGVVFVILVITKFVEGSWVVALLIPLFVWLFRIIKGHYVTVAHDLSTKDLSMEDMHAIADVVIVPLGDVHRGTLRALRYARQISKNVRAVCITTSVSMKDRLCRRWERFPSITTGLELITIDYEYRDILTPLVDYINEVTNEEFPEALITVVVPEFVPDSFWAQLLHNQTANILRARLRGSENVVVIDVPYHVRSHHPEAIAAQFAHEEHGAVMPAAETAHTDTLTHTDLQETPEAE